VKELERWIALEWLKPEGIPELMDPGGEIPDMTPEQAERMERSFLKALAAQRRELARAQKAK